MNPSAMPFLATCTAALLLLSNESICQNFPQNGEISEEIAIGGPSIDYLNLEFPRPGVQQCEPFSGETRTISGDIDTYGKALLVVIFPKDCPYCIAAADEAESIIARYRDDLTIWYANQRLNGDGSCGDISEMSAKYAFVDNADFQFIDIYMWNNDWGSSWHYGSQDSYWSRKESPSVYRIFSPASKKVTGISYYVSGIETQIQAAVRENVSSTRTLEMSGKSKGDELNSIVITTASNGRCRVTVNVDMYGGATLDILTLDGKKAMSRSFSSAQNGAVFIDTPALPSGTYVASLTTKAGKSFAKKFFNH